MSGSTDWRKLVEQVAADRESGASDVTRNCARALMEYANQANPSSVAGVEEAMFWIAETVLRGQPSMASVVRLINDVALQLAGAATVRSALDVMRRVSGEYMALVEQATDLVSSTALQVLPVEGTVLTLSYSSAVANCLVKAKQHGHALRIICLESRPNYEGRALATYLSSKGLEVILSIDAAMYDGLAASDMFLVGADSLTEAGIFNKVGTAALATVGHALGVSGYVACDTSKVWPAKLEHPVVLEQPAKEVWARVPDWIRVKNSYFECTPWELMGGVITEVGVLSGEAVAEISRKIIVDDRVKHIVSGLNFV